MRCKSCRANNPVFPDLKTRMIIETAEGEKLFEVRTKSNECIDCVREMVRMMHGEMMNAVQADEAKIKKGEEEKGDEVVKILYVNKEVLWDKEDVPVEMRKK